MNHPEPLHYQPRFDFGSSYDPQGTHTGTLADLIDELNYEDNRTVSGEIAPGGAADGRAINTRSLRRTLEFIEQVTGRTLSGANEQLPLSTLKTIKLLYNTNDASDRHLFNFIAKPRDGRPTMEFSTTTSIARDNSGAAVIRFLSDQLAKEIEPGKIESFNALFPTAEHLNLHIEGTNDEVYQALPHRWGSDEEILERVYTTLAKDVERMRYERQLDALATPLHEMLYCHLRSLGFIHYILHHRSFMEDIRVVDPIHSIDAPLHELCRTWGEAHGEILNPADKFISVMRFATVVNDHANAFINIVKTATGLDTRKTTLPGNLERAKRILASYGYRCYDETDLEAPLLSMIDIVAALCSVRYQQEARTAYKPYWPAQEDQGNSPQRHFDKAIDPKDPYQHQGVLMVFLYRFFDFQHAFMGVTKSRRAWMAYQLARMDAYVRILDLQDMDAIVACADHFDVMCLEAASTAGTTLTPS